MSVPEETAAEVLSKCGRHCCICRRFMPTMIQVHHIIEKENGGIDEFDNLIALCFTCHSDVHTHRPFARRFSNIELKQHREQVYRLVQEGNLIPLDEYEYSKSITATISNLRSCDTELSECAIKILVAAAESDGIILFFRSQGGAGLNAGKGLHKHFSDGRESAKYEAALRDLEMAELITPRGFEGKFWEVSYEGYLKSDVIASQSMVMQQTD